MAMDYPEVYQWDDKTDAEKKDAYRSLLADYRRQLKTVDAFTKVCSRLSDY
jgi:hypothetical protein